MILTFNSSTSSGATTEPPMSILVKHVKSHFSLSAKTFAKVRGLANMEVGYNKYSTLLMSIVHCLGGFSLVTKI